MLAAALLLELVVPAASPERTLQRWLPGEARCGDRAVAAPAMRRPYTELRWGALAAEPPRAFRFSLDRAGRPYAIRREGEARPGGGADIEPSLAATRFDVGEALADCRIVYSAESLPLAEAPVGDLVSYSLNPLSGPLPEAGWARIRPAGGDCDKEPRAQWLTAVSPDYRKLPGEPGARDWTLVRYDLDANGRPRDVAVATGTGDAALNEAATRALSASRQTDGPRRGCLNPYVRVATRLPAPAAPEIASLRPAGATCPREGGGWATPPRLVYPDAWRKRAIEGWAIVAYDVAPWGELGNMRVLASEPADEFGEAATRVLRAARKSPSSTGYTGCVDKVRFAMGPGTPEPAGGVRAD